jgi:hypothetical protein
MSPYRTRHPTVHGPDQDAHHNASLARDVVGRSSWKECRPRALLLENQRGR